MHARVPAQAMLAITVVPSSHHAPADQKKLHCSAVLGALVESQQLVNNPCTSRRTGAYTKAVGAVPSVHVVAIKQAALFVIIGRQGLDQARGRAASAPHIKPLSESCHQPRTQGGASAPSECHTISTQTCSCEFGSLSGQPQA
jgi:hypothetical protein